MVVVENAANKIGQTVEIEFIRSLQTAAGRMMFAKLVDNGKANSHKSITKSNHGNKQKVINRRKDYSQNPEQKIINLVNSQRIASHFVLKGQPLLVSRQRYFGLCNILYQLQEHKLIF